MKWYDTVAKIPMGALSLMVLFVHDYKTKSAVLAISIVLVLFQFVCMAASIKSYRKRIRELIKKGELL